MDSAALQAQSSGKLGESMEKAGHTTILRKTEMVALRKAIFLLFVDTVDLFIVTWFCAACSQ